MSFSLVWNNNCFSYPVVTLFITHTFFTLSFYHARAASVSELRRSDRLLLQLHAGYFVISKSARFFLTLGISSLGVGQSSHPPYLRISQMLKLR